MRLLNFKEVLFMDKSQAQFFPQPYPSAPCDSFNCLNRAVYFIGKPEGPANICHRLCRSCAESVVRSIPAELKHAIVPPEGFARLEAKEGKPVEAKSANGGNKKGEQPESTQAAQGKEVKGDACSERQ